MEKSVFASTRLILGIAALIVVGVVNGLYAQSKATTKSPTVKTQAQDQPQEARMVALLEERGGVKAKYKIVGGNAPNPSDQQTVLEQPVDIKPIEKQFGKPERIDKDAMSFAPIIVAGKIQPPIKGDYWRYGRLALFVKDGVVLQFEEWKAEAKPDDFPKPPPK